MACHVGYDLAWDHMQRLQRGQNHDRAACRHGGTRAQTALGRHRAVDQHLDRAVRILAHLRWQDGLQAKEDDLEVVGPALAAEVHELDRVRVRHIALKRRMRKMRDRIMQFAAKTWRRSRLKRRGHQDIFLNRHGHHVVANIVNVPGALLC